MKPTTSSLRLAGYVLDHTGIRELLWKRYHGIWQFAQTATIRQARDSSPSLELVLVFQGRKRPLTLSTGSGKNGALRLVQALLFAKSRQPNLAIEDGLATELLAAASHYQALTATQTSPTPEKTLAEARLEYLSLNFPKALSLVSKRIASASSYDTPASKLRFKILFALGDLDSAKLEKDHLLRHDPNDQETTLLWAHVLLARNVPGAAEHAAATIAASPNPEDQDELTFQLALHHANRKSQPQAIEQLDQLSRSPTSFAARNRAAIAKLRDDLQKSRDDKAHRFKKALRKTFFLSLALALLALALLLVSWPTLYAASDFLEKRSQRLQIENRGTPSTAERFLIDEPADWSGRVLLRYQFATETKRQPDGYYLPAIPWKGQQRLFRSDAEAILAHPESYKIRFLPEAPYKNAIHPRPPRSDLALALGYSPALLLPAIILALIAIERLNHHRRRRSIQRSLP